MKEATKNVLYFFIASGLFTWLIRSIFSQYFSKDIEKYKLELEKESIIHKIKYEKLHSERAEAIKKIYTKMIKVYKSFGSLMKPLQLATEESEEEKRKKAARAADDFTDFYDENRLFLDEKIAEKVDELSKTLRTAWHKFNISRASGEDGKAYLKYWNEAWDLIEKEVPKLKKDIEKEFRKAIGIDDD